MSIAKRKTPRTSSAMRRPLMCTQVTLSATASTVRQTPRVIKNALAPRRRVRFMLAQEYTSMTVGAPMRIQKQRPPGEGGPWEEFEDFRRLLGAGSSDRT